MNPGSFRLPFSLFIATVMTLFILITGCASTKTQNSQQAQASLQQNSTSMPVYYDFGDVLVPKELDLIKKDSFVYLSSGVTAGVLSLKGRVDINSLITFFENNMAKDNWRMLSSFRSPKTIILFQKENRWCIINIKEEMFKVYVEIWVAPTLNGVNTGSIK
jgi:hypothetical protein